MAYATINKPNTYFNTVTYTGDGTTPKTITGVNFKSDLTWIKRRDSGQGNTNHNLWNFISGAGNNAELSSNITGAEGGSSADLYGYVSAFTSDGFTVADGTDATYKNLYTNNNGGTYVAWNWLGSNTTTNNTAGTISSTVCANTTSGFSIVSYTGTGANATVGHGLGVAPKMIIVKGRSTTYDWVVWHTGIPATNYLTLNTTIASSTATTVWNSTSPTSSVFSLGSNLAVNESGATQIAYCFAEVKGFSKFGSYTGNGSTNGPFIYTGFKPAWLMIKCLNNIDQSWPIFDNKRNVYNPESLYLYANTSIPDGTETTGIDFLSNGFKIRNSYDYTNNSSAAYIYAAFAENPLVGTNNVPTTAR